ncbi:unnamed protein product [Cuscuta epithymum]|uniref:CBM-cenC domain-containing protein n=1 Tax=Cuscuta epithymum TaxID=186058 RepID=A0AAV0E9H5_9ASTE|nr:unnamed protein product [Cuscuta epithymum]
MGSSGQSSNIIKNHDFKGGLQKWYANCCKAFVDSSGGCAYAVITNRRESWQGLEQEITGRVSKGHIYSIQAFVTVSGKLPAVTSAVQATLRLSFKRSATCYLSIGRKTVKPNCWEALEGTFSLSTNPDQVIFYLEGAEPGVDILVKSVTISPSSPALKSDHTKASDQKKKEGIERKHEKHHLQVANNIILNYDFHQGFLGWETNGCQGNVVKGDSGSSYAVITNRGINYHGLLQDITNRVCQGCPYSVEACVRVSGNIVGFTDIQATLRLEYKNLDTQYHFIGRKPVSTNNWEILEGTFTLSTKPDRVLFFLEGLSGGVEMLVKSVIISYVFPSLVM